MIESLFSEFKRWDSDCDVIVTDTPLLLPPNHPVVSQHTPWAYSLNTARGFYYMHRYKVPECDVVKLPNGKSIEFKSEREVTTLRFTNLNGTTDLYEDVTVWAHSFHNDFMLVTLHKTDTTVLIDSRGVLFELPIHGIKHYHNATIEKNKREGYYLIEKSVIVYYKTKEEQVTFTQKTSANLEAVFNKDFNRFMRNNAKNETKYLYLTGGNSKCGAFVNHFIKQGMEYEIVPNVLVDDETVNIRIPIEGANATRKDVQFLCAKYHNTYSIYNIPYTEIGSILTLSDAQKAKHEKLRIYFHHSLGDKNEIISYYIVNTLRTVFNTEDDYEVHKKVFSKIVRMIDRGRGELEPNCFADLLLLHPIECRFKENYVTQHLDYINALLAASGYASWEELRKEEKAKYLFYEPQPTESNAYQLAFECSRSRFKEAMSAYESDIMYQISEAGGIISKWTSEATLFTLVKKNYPDAIFQYHTEWLGLQSLDIYIPSLRVGIEYQGEQHYRPVEIFGGEAGFKNLVERDKRKVRLCAENNVTIIHWKYDEAISQSNLKKAMSKALS